MNTHQQFLREDLTASYDPYSFLNSTRTLLLDDLKLTNQQLNPSLHKSKQITARLNKFLHYANKSLSNSNHKQPQPTFSSQKNQLCKSNNKANCEEQLDTTKNKQFIRKRIFRPSLHQIQNNSSSSDDDKNYQQDQNKRNIIYQHQNCKEKFDKLTQTDYQKQNKILNMFFSKKNNTLSTQTLSTTSSEQKRKKYHSLSVHHFLMTRKIGSGKSGQVFIARHKQSGFLCAIKKIKKSNVDPKTFTQLIRQIKIQSYLDHPNIVKLYTFFSDEEHIYLMLEYCASGDLYSLLKKSRKMDEPTVQTIIKQVCKALQYMHEQNILHRDIKPQNILFHNGLVKICDFGWSISSTVSRQTFCGTPLYVSPQLLKRNNYSNKIDVWSIGILTHELIFGRVPFDIFTEGDLIKIVEDEIKFSKHIPISLKTKHFIESCLQKDPTHRLSVSELIEHPFLTFQFH